MDDEERIAQLEAQVAVLARGVADMVRMLDKTTEAVGNLDAITEELVALTKGQDARLTLLTLLATYESRRQEPDALIDNVDEVIRRARAV